MKKKKKKKKKTVVSFEKYICSEKKKSTPPPTNLYIRITTIYEPTQGNTCIWTNDLIVMLSSLIFFAFCSHEIILIHVLIMQCSFVWQLCQLWCVWALWWQSTCWCSWYSDENDFISTSCWCIGIQKGALQLLAIFAVRLNFNTLLEIWWVWHSKHWSCWHTCKSWKGPKP